MKQLGKLEKIEDLRSIWKHEAKEFTPWLAEENNLSLLSEAIGIDLVLEEQESNVGEFSVDIFAAEEGTSRKVIIENQLEDTNKQHLKQVLQKLYTFTGMIENSRHKKWLMYAKTFRIYEMLKLDTRYNLKT